MSTDQSVLSLVRTTVINPDAFTLKRDRTGVVVSATTGRGAGHIGISRCFQWGRYNARWGTHTIKRATYADVEAFLRRHAHPASDTRPSKLRKPDECPHDPVYREEGPAFLPDVARALSSAEVRAQFPRATHRCSDCGSPVTRYASFDHFIAGDW